MNKEQGFGQGGRAAPGQVDSAQAAVSLTKVKEQCAPQFAQAASDNAGPNQTCGSSPDQDKFDRHARLEGFATEPQLSAPKTKDPEAEDSHLGVYADTSF